MKEIMVSLFATCLLLSATTIITGQKEVIDGPVDDKGTLQITDEDIIPMLLDQLDEEMMLGYIEDLVDISNKYCKVFPYSARLTGTEGCEEGADYIYQQFDEMGLDVRYQDWTAKGTWGIWQALTFISQNIEAILHGTGGSDAAYVICAHYDTAMNTPSADDNSAGVAAVLSAAKIMSQYEFNHDIRFICWSGEEQGLIGSHAYVENSYENCDNIIAAINLDMIGYTSDKIENDEYKVLVYETCSNKLIGTAIEISENPEYSQYLNLEVVPSEDDSGHISDQRSFCKFAYGSIFIHEFTWNEEKDKSSDTIENMDVDYATRVAKLAMGTLAKLALSPAVSNTPPEKPGTINGPDDGEINVRYTYTTSTTDPDGDQIYYLFDWDDGSNSGWVGPYYSDEIAHASHTWTEEGDYKIRVKAKDEHGIQSGWGEKSKNKQSINILPLKFLESFQHVLQMLRHLLKL